MIPSLRSSCTTTHIPNPSKRQCTSVHSHTYVFAYPGIRAQGWIGATNNGATGSHDGGEYGSAHTASDARLIFSCALQIHWHINNALHPFAGYVFLILYKQSLPHLLFIQGISTPPAYPFPIPEEYIPIEFVS